MNLFQRLGTRVLALTIAASGVAHAEGELVPVPDPGMQTQVIAQPTVACTVKSLADHYTVTPLFACGQRLDNTGLKGRRNRRNVCAVEATLAEVWASPKTCEDCASASKAAELRRSRPNDCQCDNKLYVEALVLDLMSYSQAVRNSAARILDKRCGYDVAVHHNECVDAPVPSYRLN